MNFMKNVFLSMLMLGLLFNLGCGNSSEKVMDFGKFEDGIYSNDFFNLTVSVPETWFVMDDESRIALMKKSQQLVAGDDANLNAVLNAADMQNISLMNAYENPPGTPVFTNPSFIIMAEDIKHAPGITKGSDYHFHSRQLMESSQMEVAFPEEIYEETISGIPFDTMVIEIETGGIKNVQKQYAAIIDNYALLFITTYQDDAGREKLEQILQTVVLD